MAFILLFTVISIRKSAIYACLLTLLVNDKVPKYFSKPQCFHKKNTPLIFSCLASWYIYILQIKF